MSAATDRQDELAPSKSLSRKSRPGLWAGPTRKWWIVPIQASLIVGALGLWQLASSSGWIDPLLFAQPSGIWTAMREYFPSEQHFSSLAATAKAVTLAFVIGSAAGTAFGLFLGLSRTADTILGIFLTPINSVPRIALAPLFIAWFGLSTTSKVVLAVSIVFFILTENARSAVRSVDEDITRMARVVGLSPVAILWKVVLPSSVPTLFAGLRLAYTYSLLGVIASEMVAATSGLGQDIVLFSSSFRVDYTFAVLIELMVIAVVVIALFSAVERRLLRWQS